MEVIQQMAAVGLVLVLLGASLWVLRRRGIAGFALAGRPARRRLECLERMPLGPQHTLHLVRVDGRELLVASSPSVESLPLPSSRPCRRVRDRPGSR